MELQKLHENRLVAVAKQEQAFAWLIEHGPLLANPPLPSWALKALERDRRILRLRKGLYLAPRANGELPKLAEVMALLNPDGYISGHGALYLRGLNDQSIRNWFGLATRRIADVQYADFRVHFVLSPAHAQTGERTPLNVMGVSVAVATVSQALLDEARFMPSGFDYVETAKVLRNSLDSRQTSPANLARLLARNPSVTVARRLGFLSDLVTDQVDPGLHRMALANDGTTRLSGDTHHDKTWRLWTPQSRAAILRASS